MDPELRDNAAAAGASSRSALVTFLAHDGTSTVSIARAHAQQSLLLRDLLDGTDDNEDSVVPTPQFDVETLQLVASYMQLRHNNPPRDIERPLREPLLKLIDDIDRAFITPLNETSVLKLVSASNFLNVPALSSLVCARCADWMCDKNVEEIRDMFGISCDFSAEELAALKKEHGGQTEGYD